MNPVPPRPNNNNNNNNNNNELALPPIRSNQDLRDLSSHRFAPEQAISMDGSSPSISSGASHGWSAVEVNGGTPPSARSLHAAALLNGVMYVFGGYDGLQRVNTFHAFSFVEKRWSPVLPSANSSPPPSPRDRHVAVAFGNSFYVHGGFDGTSRVSDFWQFDFSSMAWREVVVLGGRAPSPRHSHAAVVHRNSMYVFGGYDGSYKSDLHEFDLTTNQWSAVPAAGRRPRARYRATAVVCKNLMILYGGHDGTRHLSDTHLFDFDTRTWTALTTEGTPPIPRDSHVSVTHANSMYIFGGSSGSAMNDLHELQLPSIPSAPGKWYVHILILNLNCGGIFKIDISLTSRHSTPVGAL
jgi:leucine-zipper-like transcriptional regulator 1